MTRSQPTIPGVLGLCCLFQAPVLGQQVPGGWRHATPLVAADECSACHTSHVQSGGARMLKGDPSGGGVQAWLQAQAPGAGISTIACLRCHWTSQERRETGAFPIEPLNGGAFLGPDLADDHPLGSTDPRTPRLWNGQTPRYTPSKAMSDREVIECTTCHVAHKPGAAVPRGAERQRLCGGCHPVEAKPVDQHSSVPCTGCHQLHDARQPQFLRETTIEQMCTRCHSAGGAPQAIQSSGQESREDSPLTVTPSHNAGSNCLQCHAVHQGG